MVNEADSRESLVDDKSRGCEVRSLLLGRKRIREHPGELKHQIAIAPLLLAPGLIRRQHRDQAEPPTPFLNSHHEPTISSEPDST